MKMSMEMLQEPELSVYWDTKLTAGEDNPFPLAPHDLVDKGLVTDENYQRENKLLTRFCYRHMTAELTTWKFGPGHIEILGAGLLRDIEWLPKAAKMDFTAAIRDISMVACERARQFLKERNLLRKVEVTHTEVERAWKSGTIDDERTTWYYGGQFVQNQGADPAWRIMRHFGAFLAQPGHRRVYLLHALGEDNDPDKVEWGSTTPYTEEQLYVPLEFEFRENGGEGKVRMDVMGKHSYYHQIYTLFRIEAARELAGGE